MIGQQCDYCLCHVLSELVWCGETESYVVLYSTCEGCRAIYPNLSIGTRRLWKDKQIWLKRHEV